MEVLDDELVLDDGLQDHATTLQDASVYDDLLFYLRACRTASSMSTLSTSTVSD